MSWYYKKWFVWLMVLIFFPVGLALMWKSPLFGTKTRVIVTGFFALLIIGGMNRDPNATTDSHVQQSTSAKPAPAPAPDTPPQKKIKVYGPGQMKVGTDIPEGEYVAIGSGYLEVAANSSGTFDSIIMNDNVVNRRYITVYNGEYVKAIGSLKLVAAADAPKVDTSKGQIPEGQYKVGVDIPVGEYNVQSLGEGYVEVAVNDRGNLEGIITNANLQGKSTMYITVGQGEYLKLLRATASLPR